jgi:general transcription factor 3C polypeptide 6
MQREEEEEDAKNGHNRGEQEKKQHDEEEEEEEQAEEEEEETEYVVLDLDEVFNGAAVPANCAYTLTGLDTMAPVLTLGNGLKLIGEYEETMGSVLIFSESGAFPVTFFLC